MLYEFPIVVVGLNLITLYLESMSTDLRSR